MRRRRVARRVGKVPPQRIGKPVVDVEQGADVDRVLDGVIRKTSGTQGRDIGGTHVVRPQRELLEEPKRRAQLRVDRRGAPVGQDCLYDFVILEGQRRDRAVRLRSKDALIEFRGKRGEQLALTHAPVGRPAHHGLCPRALRRAEELGPVHQGLHDVRDAAATDQPDQP